MQKQFKKLYIRVDENLLASIKEEARRYEMSLNCYINFALNKSVNKYKIQFTESLKEQERKEVEIRVFLTNSEAGLLRKYALSHGWSLTKEIRYRLISTIAIKPKLTHEELSAIRGLRSNINILGSNINRLIRDKQVLTRENADMCLEIITLIKQLKNKIDWLAKCNNTRFQIID